MNKKGKLWMVKRITHHDHPGYTVRVGEYRPSGPLHVFYWLKGKGGEKGKPKSEVLKPRTYRADLGEGAKEQEREAIKRGREFIAKLGAHDLTPMSQRRTPLTFKELYELYAANALTACKFADDKDAVPGAKDFCIPYQCERGHVTQSHRKDALARVLNTATFFGLHKPVADLLPVDVKRWVDRRIAQGKLAALRSDLEALSTACKWAVEDADLLVKNPLLRARKLWRGLGKPKRPIFTEAQYRDLLAVADQVQKPYPTHKGGDESPQSVAARNSARAFPILLTVAWESGRRLGAILRLRWEDLQLTPSKGAPFGRVTWYRGAPERHRKRREMTLKLNAALLDAFTRWRKNAPSVSGYVFPSPRLAGKPMESTLADKWLKRAKEMAGIEHEKHAGWHAFRRGCVSHLSANGRSIAGIAEYVGHSDKSTTLTSYTQVVPDELDAISLRAS